MTSQFNREYRGYQPNANSGPPTERICKPVKCDGRPAAAPPSPPAPSP